MNVVVQVDGMLKQLPIKPETFTADATYRTGHLRKQLDDMGIVANIPFHPNQLGNMVAKGGFDYRGDHQVCPKGKVLRRSATRGKRTGRRCSGGRR